MTLDEKLLNILTKYYLNAEDNINQADRVAIAELKQWGREMCDNQKELCAPHANEFPKHYLGAIITTPYPKELE